MYNRIRDTALGAAAYRNHIKADSLKKRPETTGSAAGTGRSGTGDATDPPAGIAPLRNGTSVAGRHSDTEKKQVVFGIRLAEGTVTIAPVLCPDPGIITALPIPTMQRGNILFIDAYGKTYQGFITYLPDRHGKDIVRIRARDGLPWSPLGEFWNFASRSWTSHKGLLREQIPAFVQELAFRYNNRGTDLFPVLLERIAKLYTRS